MSDKQTVGLARRVMVERCWQAELTYARSLQTDDLKRLWDEYDGMTFGDINTSAEAVHTVLNERGEGQYCAI